MTLEKYGDPISGDRPGGLPEGDDDRDRSGRGPGEVYRDPRRYFLNYESDRPPQNLTTPGHGHNL